MFTQEEFDYILEQGLEKIAEEADVDEEDMDEEELLEALAEEEAAEEAEEELEKAAAAYGLTPDEFEYLFEQGLEKIAQEALGPATPKKIAFKNRVKDMVAKFKGLHPAAKWGIGAGAALGLGGAGYALARRRREKTASGFSEAELAYIFEQGLEKIAEGSLILPPGTKRPKQGRLRTARARLANRWAKLPRAAKIALIAGGGLGAAGGGYAAYRKRRQKTASLDGLDAESLEYILEQGLEKIASEVDEGENPSAYDIVRGMLMED